MVPCMDVTDEARQISYCTDRLTPINPEISQCHWNCQIILEFSCVVVGNVWYHWWGTLHLGFHVQFPRLTSKFQLR